MALGLIEEFGGQASGEMAGEDAGTAVQPGIPPPVEAPPAEVPGVEAPPVEGGITQEEQDARNARNIAARQAAGGPDLPPVPQVPPPPVSFQLGGQGGGEASSFARPGSAAARPFRSSNFATSRLEGGGPGERRAGFGAGSAIVGGGNVPPVSDFNSGGNAGGLGGENDDELAQILAQIAGRYQGGRR